jgi:subtilisin family serine protease
VVHRRTSRGLGAAFLLLMALTVGSYADSVRHGYLMGNVSGAGTNGPKEGDIQFRDSKGHWYLVQGIPVNPQPYNDQSQVLAVIDSGVLPDHPQLKGLIAEQRDFTGEGPEDRIGHGTLVTILTLTPIAGLPLTNSPRIIEAKVANADGTIDKNALIYAIQWVAERGARIVNLSLGFPEGTDDYSGVCDAIAKHPEIFFIAAAGNSGPSVKVYPAACKSDNVLSVSATDPDGNLASYSGVGDVAGPGTVTIVPSNLGP